MPSWESFNPSKDPLLESGQAVIHYMSLAKGGYYDEAGDEIDTATQLKRMAVEAKGGDVTTAHLITLDEWFTRHFK